MGTCKPRERWPLRQRRPHPRKNSTIVFKATCLRNQGRGIIFGIQKRFHFCKGTQTPGQRASTTWPRSKRKGLSQSSDHRGRGKTIQSPAAPGQERTGLGSSGLRAESRRASAASGLDGRARPWSRMRAPNTDRDTDHDPGLRTQTIPSPPSPDMDRRQSRTPARGPRAGPSPHHRAPVRTWTTDPDPQTLTRTRTPEPDPSPDPGPRTPEPGPAPARDGPDLRLGVHFHKHSSSVRVVALALANAAAPRVTGGLDGAVAQLPLEQRLHVPRAWSADPPQAAQGRSGEPEARRDWVNGGRGRDLAAAGSLRDWARGGTTWVGRGCVGLPWGPETPRSSWPRARPGVLLAASVTCP